MCVQSPYSWTNKLLSVLLNRFNVSVSFVDGTNAENFRSAIQDNTRVIYLESPNSFLFELQDLKAVCEIAKEKNITTIIDNSYAGPLYQKPLQSGVDLVVYTATKYLGGHSDLVAGAVCGSKESIRQIFISEYMTLGGIISPHDAWLMLRSLRTLPLRMQGIAASTEKVASFLEEHHKVEKIYYPFSKTHPQYRLAKQQMSAAPGLFSILLKTTNVKSIEAFCNSLKRFLMAVSWGGHESLIFPACVFYNSDGSAATHLPVNLVRIYIGLEEPDALIKDLDIALKAI
ncbi:MAG TPA: PLP-dependent transferase [Flavobacterium sp.]|nr:PLP-dependent transferase [Flavobacterium sp.]